MENKNRSKTLTGGEQELKQNMRRTWREHKENTKRENKNKRKQDKEAN